jgi:uncharacterized membrane protein (DUF4010 family)
MNVFELLFFLLFSLAVGFLGHLISPHYGWLVSAVVGGPILVLLPIGPALKRFREFRRGWRSKRVTHHFD